MNMISEESGLVVFWENKTVYQKLTQEIAGLGTGLLISLLPMLTLIVQECRVITYLSGAIQMRLLHI
jgi:hypothetical protein